MTRILQHGAGIISPNSVALVGPTELRRGEHLVYRFINAGGECVYIGVTGSPRNRWEAHKRKGWFGEVSAIYYTAGMSLSRAWLVERFDILAERPRCNRTVNR